jgi:phosphotransferase system enzyme I (PtsI)
MSRTRAERVFVGQGVAPGIAVGPLHRVESGVPPAPEYEIAAEAVEAEIERFRSAVQKAKRQLQKLGVKAASLGGAAAETLGDLLEARLQMLSGSRLLRGVEKRIAGERRNAEAALQAEIAGIAAGFEAMDDAYLKARVEDVREVGGRLLRILLGKAFRGFAGLEPGTVIVADLLTPADTATMDPKLIGGFATEHGGSEGHTAIMARSLGLPAVLGAGGLMKAARAGDRVVVEGDTGRITLRPSAETLARIRRRQDALARDERVLDGLRALPAVTADGAAIALYVNVDLPGELEAAARVGAAGIGLMRTEYMFMNREDLPSEDEQYERLKVMVEGMMGRPTTIRTLDIGSDKIAPALGRHIGDAENPALGLRAIRLSFEVPSLLNAQLGAVLRASTHGPVRVLLPMVTQPSDILAVKKTLERLARKRRVKTLPPVGAMIEVPAAALAADQLARVADFFSIGTNDLTMYTLAADRGDLRVARYYDPLHPALLRLIQFSTEAARRAGIPIALCGEMAGDPRFAALLIGLGLRELSMAPHSLPRVKQRIRALDLAVATPRAYSMLEQRDSGRIAAILDDLNALF